MLTKRLRMTIVATLCVATLAIAGVALSGCGSDTTSSSTSSTTSTSDYKLVNAGELTIGSDLDYKPMEYLDSDEKPEGFDVAMMTEVSKRLGLKLNYLAPQNFDTLITQVAAGTKMDVAVSSITITDERKELVDFSSPYYDSNQAVVIRKDSSYTDKSQLNGETVGAQSGTSGEEWVKENYTKSKYVPYNSTSDLLAALRAGKIEAAVYDEPVAENGVANEYKDCKILSVIPTGEQYGIAINKSNTALETAINKALADMQSDGTMDKLKETWIKGSK